MISVIIISFQESNEIDKLKTLEAHLIMHIQVCVQWSILRTNIIFIFTWDQCSIVTQY